jgi:transcriptional regulator of acetoin/glycerol metabolism
MVERNRFTKIERLKLAWQHFADKGELMPGVRPVIARSWFRCKKYGLSPYEQPIISLHNTENQADLTAKLNWEQAVVTKVLKQCLTWLNSQALLFLIHDSGLIVDAVGSLAPPFLPGLQPGQVISEKVFGTFGPALALQGEEMVEVLGYEHFMSCFHDFRSAAVNLLNNDESWLLGVVLPLEESGPQVLGLLQATAQILNIQLQKSTTPDVCPSSNKRQDVVPLADLERLEIIKALEVCEANITHAALMLGVSRNTLYNRMKKYGIEVG